MASTSSSAPTDNQYRELDAKEYGFIKGIVFNLNSSHISRADKAFTSHWYKVDNKLYRVDYDANGEIDNIREDLQSPSQK